MTLTDRALKRTFDIAVATTALVLLSPVIAIGWIIARYDTDDTGFFRQTRVGRNGVPFKVVKLRTMRAVGGTTVTTANDARITPLGARLRRLKIDELPQLWNVLRGEMSCVGPRPDVPGFMDRLNGRDLKLLRLRPGMTGPATLKYRREEEILAGVEDPEAYNAHVIWPDKVAINLTYLHNWSFRQDIRYLVETLKR